MDVRIKRVYEPKAATDGERVLIDRLWPRGFTHEDAQVDDGLTETSGRTPSCDAGLHMTPLASTSSDAVTRRSLRIKRRGRRATAPRPQGTADARLLRPRHRTQ